MTRAPAPPNLPASRPRHRRLRRMHLSLLMLPALAAGCTQMISSRVPYYEDDPWQPRPPQGFLYRGTGVWVLENKGGYARVLTGDLIHGWVWADAIVPMDWDAESDRPEQEYEIMETKPRNPS